MKLAHRVNVPRFGRRGGRKYDDWALMEPLRAIKMEIRVRNAFWQDTVFL